MGRALIRGSHKKWFRSATLGDACLSKNNPDDPVPF